MEKAKQFIETELPKYVKLGGSELRLRISQKDYWRDAGYWGVKYKIKDGKLLSSHWGQGHQWLHDVELIPITEEEWRKGNAGYI